MYFFIADEHLGHKNIIKYSNRPFSSVHEMNQEIIDRYNSVVGEKDIVVHAGDFTLEKDASKYIRQLKGNHIFIKGSHDKWLGRNHPIQIWEKKIEGQYLVVCHYCMKVWPRSQYNSWLLYGHSHGRLPPEGKSWDISVDNNDFYPLSFEQIKEIMDKRPDNFNLVKNKR